MAQQDIGLQLVPVYYSDTGTFTQHILTKPCCPVVTGSFAEAIGADPFPEQSTSQSLVTDVATRDHRPLWFIEPIIIAGTHKRRVLRTKLPVPVTQGKREKNSPWRTATFSVDKF